MDTTLKTKWVEALRSGKYQQGKGCLKPDDNSYCCLGVLCEVAGWPINDSGINAIVPDVKGLQNRDTYAAIGSYGIPCKTIFQMNDSENKTFTEIAEYVEKNL